ncbi:MAG: helix-turn-helix domain-containing protein [Christensenellales bacterium]
MGRKDCKRNAGRVCKACIGQRKEQQAALCREYGISRPTGDKWLQRFQEGQPLSDRSRAPQRQAGRVSPEMEASIVQLRQQYPALGAEKLRKIMETEEVRICPVHAHSTTSLHATISSPRTQVWRRLISSALKKRSPTTCGRRISKEILLLPTAFAAIR